ncbi:unnamed protein product [Symbiodinium necroappetens]|uniref:Uncharacterized protein n=1 Tax=Symbiodinium necroappetens TaxID=1628268 RepID=A0A812XGM2_9DINO|nr:unnamed protein product [Symbiodinium necroappetens]
MVVTEVMQHMTMPSLGLDAVEKYAGVKTIATAFRSMDLKAASFEMNDDPVTEDIQSGLGFAYGLALTLRLFRNAGLNFEAPVCSTWVWVNRATSGRSRAYPLGDMTREQVRAANKMVARTCIYLLVLSSLRLPWCIEQPVYMFMGAYGGDSLKPTFIYSNYKYISELNIPLPDHVCEWGSMESNESMVNQMC